MNNIFKSIRWRLQMWHGLILLIVLTSFCFTAYALIRDNRMRRIDQELQRQASAILDALRPMDVGKFMEPPGGRRGFGPPRPGPGGRRFEERFESEFRPPRSGEDLANELARLDEQFTSAGYYFMIWTPDGALHKRSAAASEDIPMPVLEGPDFAPVMQTRGKLRELGERNRRGHRVVVGHDLAPALAEVNFLAWRMASVGFGVLLLGLACGWWLATRAIQPIADISASAKKIAAGNLAERINVKDTASEFGQLAQVLNTTFARLQASFARQAEFTADASHELRTPVSIVLSQAQTTLARERTSGEYRECVEACQRAAHRMWQLIESLLVLARLDSGEATAAKEPCELDKIASEVIVMLRPLATERQINVQTELTSVTCIGDAGQISQAVTNLVSNAIHYNRPGGEVRVKVAHERDQTTLVVSDTGIGMAPEDLPHIFERFYRADKSRSRAQGRTGLGLAITKAIVETHGGTIEVQSQLGQGSTFTVRLPLRAG